MNKLLTALLLTASMTMPVFAEQQGHEFYTNQAENWNVGGYSGDPSLNPACYAEYTFQDGSVFQLIKDLADGELYMFIRNITWEISDAPGEYSMIINFRRSNGDLSPASGNYYYQLVNKNTITVNWLSVDQFIPAFMDTIEIQMIMPGTIQNAFIPLDGSSQATTLLAECIKLSKEVKLTYPSQDKVLPEINS